MVKFEILNQQKIIKLNPKQLYKYLKKIIAYISSAHAYNLQSQKISILFCDNNFIRRLNKKYFKKNCSTDVIAFPLKDKLTPDYLGEIVVSIEKARANSQIYKNSFKREILLYLVHGILHLLGYTDLTQDKRQIMEKKQEEIMRKLSASSFQPAAKKSQN